jgi:hypothetical protein
MLRATLQAISSEVAATAASLAEAKAAWRAFLSSLVVSYVQGERPQATDSGHLFARKARQVLDIADSQILDPADAIDVLLDRADGTLLLVDDFVGSGNQMAATWIRSYTSASGRRGDFRALQQNGVRVIYCPLVATGSGLDILKGSCPGLEIRPAHEIDSHYSLTHADSILWPDELKPLANDFIYNASLRAGIVDDAPHGWQGFHDLALGLAFWHSVPDATLPLFHWSERGWAPLMRRT